MLYCHVIFTEWSSSEKPTSCFLTPDFIHLHFSSQLPTSYHKPDASRSLRCLYIEPPTECLQEAVVGRCQLVATRVDNHTKKTIGPTGPGEAHSRQGVALRLRVKRTRLRDGSFLAEVGRLLTYYVLEKSNVITDLLDEGSPLTSSRAIIIENGMIVEITSGIPSLIQVTMAD